MCGLRRTEKEDVLEVVASDGDAAQSERVAMHSSRPSVSVKDLKEAWEKLGGDYSTLEFKPPLQDHFLQQQERSTVTADAASKWSQSLGRAMSVAADAEVFVKVMNDNMHKNKCKELEVQVIVSSLLLGVAGAGLFGVSSLPEEHSFMKTPYHGCFLHFDVFIHGLSHDFNYVFAPILEHPCLNKNHHERARLLLFPALLLLRIWILYDSARRNGILSLHGARTHHMDVPFILRDPVYCTNIRDGVQGLCKHLGSCLVERKEGSRHDGEYRVATAESVGGICERQQLSLKQQCARKRSAI